VSVSVHEIPKGEAELPMVIVELNAPCSLESSTVNTFDTSNEPEMVQFTLNVSPVQNELPETTTVSMFCAFTPAKIIIEMAVSFIAIFFINMLLQYNAFVDSGL
jgi:hypothetical protein